MLMGQVMTILNKEYSRCCNEGGWCNVEGSVGAEGVKEGNKTAGLYNAMVVPTLLYGCKMWTVQKRHESRLQACEMMYLRRIEGVSRRDRVRNVDDCGSRRITLNR